MHFPDTDEPFAVVYHLHSFKNNLRIRLKFYTADKEPVFPTITTLFESANWMERETWDFFGIHFEGHPNLKRILNVDDMTDFPLRKDFPLEDQTREDKMDKMFGR
jgi:NADH-quinone oxidoreductase subunit C